MVRMAARSARETAPAAGRERLRWPLDPLESASEYFAAPSVVELHPDALHGTRLRDLGDLAFAAQRAPYSFSDDEVELWQL